MAFNGMKVIQGNLRDRLRYIINPQKTEDGLLIAGINTVPSAAYDDMMATKRRYGKLDQRQGYHIIQSFKPGEIEPSEALRFGMEFIDKYLDNRYEGVAAVHTDKAHVHVHILFNSVSYMDGRKYHAAKGEYLERIRSLCDQQCRAWGLSVIEGDFTKRNRPKYEQLDRQQGKPTCREMIRSDIDRALTESYQWEGLLLALKRQGYQIRETKANVSLKPPGLKRFIRLRSLGDRYQPRDLKDKLREKLIHIMDVTPPRDVPLPQDEALDRYIGIQADTYNITQQMRQLIAKQHMRYSPALRAEIRKLDQWSEDLSFETRHGITTPDQLRAFQTQTQCLMAEIIDRRAPIYRERRTAAARDDPARMAELDAKLSEYKGCLANLRRELRIARRIEARLLSKVPEMLAAEAAQRLLRQQSQTGSQHFPERER